MPVNAKIHEDVKNAADDKPPPQRWRRARDVVDEIEARKSEPWVPLSLGCETIAEVRAGGIALLIGASGAGKTSCAACLLLEHARDHGPAVSCSIELPADEWVARAIGTRCETSWRGVLRGELPPQHMRDALPERLVIIDREHASLAELERAIEAMQSEYPDEPILAAVDYVQLCGADDDDEIRPRIGKVMRQIDSIARRRRTVVIALSQGSRASARGLSSGERIGADTTDAGAEAADLERWSTLTLAIGKLADPSEDGTRASEIHIGKSRMGDGDRVLPARYDGRSGRWRVTGESRSASEVRTERATQRDEAKVTNAAHVIVGVLGGSSEPMSARMIRQATHINRDVVNAALAVAQGDGRVVRVRGKKSGGIWPLWTPDKAAEHGVGVVPEGVGHG